MDTNKYTREQLLYYIQLCEKTGRYEESTTFFDQMIRNFKTITKTDRLYLDKIVKNIVRTMQTKLHKLSMLISHGNEEGNIF
jgi:hypothetical protein